MILLISQNYMKMIENNESQKNIEENKKKIKNYKNEIN